MMAAADFIERNKDRPTNNRTSTDSNNANNSNQSMCKNSRSGHDNNDMNRNGDKNVVKHIYQTLIGNIENACLNFPAFDSDAPGIGSILGYVLYHRDW